MFGRFASILGFIAGLFTILGALVAGLGSAVAHAIDGATSGGGLIVELIVVGLGIAMTLVSRPRWMVWRGRELWDGVVLFFAGALAWILLGGVTLVLVGALLAVFGGLLFVVAAFSPRRWPARHRFLRRRIV
ncbi:MAG TPA: hypothetical protein VFF67_05185 [Thermoplasmata archaeon]|nr:hypothetical protein [Thermoplasmata archaeon]